MSSYPCWLTENGCPGGITGRANPDDWAFPKCKGEGRGWTGSGYAPRTKACPAYLYYKGQSDRELPWMACLREKEDELTEEEIRQWARYYMGLGPEPGQTSP